MPELALQYIGYENEFQKKVIFSHEKPLSTSEKKTYLQNYNTRFSEIIISLNKRSEGINIRFRGWVSGDIIGKTVQIE